MVEMRGIVGDAAGRTRRCYSQVPAAEELTLSGEVSPRLRPRALPCSSLRTFPSARNRKEPLMWKPEAGQDEPVQDEPEDQESCQGDCWGRSFRLPRPVFSSSGRSYRVGKQAS